MTITLDAATLAPKDRAESIRTLIWEAVVRVEITHHHDPSSIQAKGRISEAGHLNICSIRSNATTVTRTPRLALDPVDPFLFLGLQASGSSIVIQDDREAVLRSGDMALYDTRKPYTLVNQQGIHQHFFRIPISALELPASVLGATTAVRLDGARPLARITSAHLRELAVSADDLSGREAGRVATASLALIRAMLASQVEGLPGAGAYLEDSLEFRILQFMRAHLHEPDLSATRIASEHHVSVRHLYRLLARSEIVLGDWIRQHRLEAARDELAAARTAVSIRAVAHAWGFVDLTHFGRMFKATFGMTPTEWRNRSLESRHPAEASNVAHPAEDVSR